MKEAYNFITIFAISFFSFQCYSQEIDGFLLVNLNDTLNQFEFSSYEELESIKSNIKNRQIKYFYLEDKDVYSIPKERLNGLKINEIELHLPNTSIIKEEDWAEIEILEGIFIDGPITDFTLTPNYWGLKFLEVESDKNVTISLKEAFIETVSINSIYIENIFGLNTKNIILTSNLNKHIFKTVYSNKIESITLYNSFCILPDILIDELELDMKFFNQYFRELKSRKSSIRSLKIRMNEYKYISKKKMKYLIKSDILLLEKFVLECDVVAARGNG